MTPEDRTALAAEIACHLRPNDESRLTEEERRWVKMAIRREAELVQKVIIR